VGFDVHEFDELAVVGFVLFGDDFDVLEIGQEAGLGEFALLVEQVAFGHDDESIIGGKRRQDVWNTWKQFDGLVKDGFAGFKEFCNNGGRNLTLTDSDCRFDEGEGEGHGAVAVPFHIAHLSLVEFVGKHVFGLKSAQQVTEFQLNVLKIAGIGPKCVVCIETDDFDGFHESFQLMVSKIGILAGLSAFGVSF